jgi:hypothetical protein
MPTSGTARMAAMVLAAAPKPAEVLAVQRQVLVPIELIVLGHGPSGGISVADLEVMVVGLLSCRGERERRHLSDG